ncbi:hypothetical protein NG2371_03723 [Nocardia gamkensis]|nr:hypothetical protein [Nocardia gamkensis]
MKTRSIRSSSVLRTWPSGSIRDRMPGTVRALEASHPDARRSCPEGTVERGYRSCGATEPRAPPPPRIDDHRIFVVATATPPAAFRHYLDSETDPAGDLTGCRRHACGSIPTNSPHRSPTCAAVAPDLADASPPLPDQSVPLPSTPAQDAAEEDRARPRSAEKTNSSIDCRRSRPSRRTPSPLPRAPLSVFEEQRGYDFYHTGAESACPSVTSTDTPPNSLLRRSHSPAN